MTPTHDRERMTNMPAKIVGGPLKTRGTFVRSGKQIRPNSNKPSDLTTEGTQLSEAWWKGRLLLKPQTPSKSDDRPTDLKKQPSKEEGREAQR